MCWTFKLSNTLGSEKFISTANRFFPVSKYCRVVQTIISDVTGSFKYVGELTGSLLFLYDLICI